LKPHAFDPEAAATGASGIYGLPFTPDAARVVGVPVPFEATTSYGGGTSRGPAAVLEASKQVGGPQIQNRGTVGGNIANGSPIGDTLPYLFVADAQLELAGTSGTRLVPIQSFYRGYKTLDLAADEIITRILIPMPARADTLRLYKVSKRSHLDISSFTAAMLMRRSGDRIDSIRIAYGGVGPMILRLPKTETFLTGKPFSLDSLEDAGAIAKEEITPISDVRGSRDFRLQLAENVLRKFYYDVAS